MLLNNRDMSRTGGAVYEITIQGIIHERLSDWFDGLEITQGQGPEDKPFTIIKGVIVDQSELRGLLTRLWDLNAVVIALHQTSHGFSNQENSQNGENDL
jgi:hypothetical protein